MKTRLIFASAALSAVLFSCGSGESQTTAASPESSSSASTPVVGQSGVKDDISNPNIVQVASGSADHSTLVAAVKAASLVDALSNAGPFTVFAPVNAAFEKLPPGTVEDLLKPEKLKDLQMILEYHTYVGSLKTDYMNDGQEYEMVSGHRIKITKKDGKTFVNDKAEVVTTIPTSNGLIHVINEVLLPPAK